MIKFSFRSKNFHIFTSSHLHIFISSHLHIFTFTTNRKMNRKISPSIKDAIEYKLELKPYEHYSLDNGVPVYSINAGAQDVLQVEMVFFAGNSFEQQKGVAAATNFLLKNGTASRSALQVNEAFEYYGAYCNRACYNETATWLPCTP